jgi:hypothetical protein
MGRARDLANILSSSGNVALDSELGLSLITPTSIAVTGGSGSISSSGAVSFTSASTISLNDVFSATYDNYVLSTNLIMSTLSGIRIRYRVAGADNTTSNYNQQTNEVNNTAVNVERQTGITIHDLTYRSGNTQSGIVNIFNPFATTKTLATTNFATVQTDTPFNNFAMLNFGATTSFTGCSLIAINGNITGTISVYGYRK